MNTKETTEEKKLLTPQDKIDFYLKRIEDFSYKLPKEANLFGAVEEIQFSVWRLKHLLDRNHEQ